MQSSAKFLLVLSFFSMLCVGVLYHLHMEWITIDQTSAIFGDYSRGFESLIEHELAKNSAASKPSVNIKQITETNNELSINYEVSYSERFRDGEKILRSSKGWALLRKDRTGTEWRLYRIQDAQQTLRFNKGTRIGS